jgi:hypothetical protein
MIVFVTGSSRSGTTMMSRILNNHSSIFSFNELHFFEQLCSSEKLDKNISKEEAIVLADKLIGVQKEGFLHYRKRKGYLSEAAKIQTGLENCTPISIYTRFINYYAQTQKKEFGCDQTPRNILYIEDILTHISDAKIICMVRDPRAVLLSQKGKWKRKFLGANKIPYRESVRSFFNYHPYTITRLWVAAVKQALKWRNNPNVLLLRFEDLVDAPEENIQRVCSFLNIAFEPSMLQIPHVGSSNKLDSKDNLVGISATAKDTWKNGCLSSAEKYICQRTAGAYMSSLGYETITFNRKPSLTLISQAIIFPFKTIISLLLNLKRVKNLKQAVLKRL